MKSLSIWEKQTSYAPADVLIIGAGLMGLWTALELKKSRPALRITLVERNSTPLGASTRNAGFACFGSPTELLSDIETMGEAAMLDIAAQRWQGIQKIRNHFSDEVIGFDPCGGYECINGVNSAELDDQLTYLNRLLLDVTGTAALFERVTEQMPQLGLRGFDQLVANRTEAGLHSGQLVEQLSALVQSRGVRILYGLTATRFERTNQGYTLFLDNHTSLTAAQLVCCTNAFTNELLQEPAIQPGRGQIILTSPIPNLPMQGTFHFDEGFYYWRHLGNRILLGGGRNIDFDGEATTCLEGSAPIRDALTRFLLEHLNPDLHFTVEQSWSGIMGFTASKRPFTGFTAAGPYAAIACNGMGVALTPIIAETVATDILNQF